MKLAVDVHYQDNGAAVAGVAFTRWEAEKPDRVYRARVECVNRYEHGQFYRRELPCIIALLEQYNLRPDVIVIDGYVYLDGYEKPGLGKHLFDALQGRATIVGVAKNPFRGIGPAFEVFRGRSTKPLYVTCAGLELDEAKARIRQMHGAHRIPTLLKAVDRLCRSEK